MKNYWRNLVSFLRYSFYHKRKIPFIIEWNNNFAIKFERGMKCQKTRFKWLYRYLDQFLIQTFFSIYFVLSSHFLFLSELKKKLQTKIHKKSKFCSNPISYKIIILFGHYFWSKVGRTLVNGFSRGIKYDNIKVQKIVNGLKKNTLLSTNFVDFSVYTWQK